MSVSPTALAGGSRPLAAVPEVVPPRRRPGDVLREALLVLPHLLRLLVRLLRDPRVPMRRKVLAGAVLAYVVAPVDLVPDVLPGVGQLDDVVLVLVAVHLLLRGAGREVALEHWDGSEDALDLVDAFFAFGMELLPGPVRRFLAR